MIARSGSMQDEIFGEYRVLDVLGHGAMGIVYRAHDPRLDRDVALKIVHPGRVAKDANKARARLVAEARALARVSHPNVLQVYDVGVHDGLVFVAVELVEGTDLAQWLRTTTRPWQDIVAVFVEAAQGLAAVHDTGLVHRDIKPANILVEKSSGPRAFGRVLVADFGIARSSTEPLAIAVPGELGSGDDTQDEDASLTEEGRVVGTPAYMAPEQHLGLDAEPAADQYALCVALHEALYGQRPFTGPGEVMVRAKMIPPAEPPPSTVPRWLWPLVRRGFSPSASDRFPSMNDLVAALRRGEPRRRRAPIIVALAVLGLAVVAWTVSYARAQPCQSVRDQVADVWNEGRRRTIAAAFVATERANATRTWANVGDRIDAYAETLAAMYQDACEATRVHHEQTEAVFDRRVACLDKRQHQLAQSLAVLEDADGSVVDHAEDIAASLDPIEACADVAALEAGMPPPAPDLRDAVAEVRRVLAEAEALEAAGRYEDAARRADVALAAARGVDYAPALVEALTIAGEYQERESRIADARVLLDEAVSVGLQIGYDEYIARAVIMLTWIAAEYERDVEAAEQWAALGRSRLERIGDPTKSALALHNALGTAYANAGRHDDALREYQRALARGESDPDLSAWVATLHANIGSLRQRLGDLDGSRASYARALELFRARYGDEHPNVVNTEIRIAQIDHLAGRHPEAIAGLRRGIAALERIQSTPTELATAHIALGQALRSAGAVVEANDTHRRAVELLTDTGDDVSLAHALVAYGQLCVEQGIYDAAEAQFQRAADLLEPIERGDPQLANAWIGLGHIREIQSRPDEALSLYKRAYEASGPAGAKTRLAARALVSIALLHHTAARYDDASAALDEQDAILAAAPLATADDRLSAAIARVRVLVDAGRAAEATTNVATLDRLLDEARAGAGSRWIGEGDLVVGRARIARGEVDAGCVAVARALETLDATFDADLVATARTAHELCTRDRPP